MDERCEHDLPFAISKHDEKPLHRYWRPDVGESEWGICDAPPPLWTSADRSASHYRRLSFGYPAQVR